MTSNRNPSGKPINPPKPTTTTTTAHTERTPSSPWRYYLLGACGLEGGLDNEGVVHHQLLGIRHGVLDETRIPVSMGDEQEEKENIG